MRVVLTGVHVDGCLSGMILTVVADVYISQHS